MMTQLLRTILMGVSLVGLLGVLERLNAAVWKLVKFDFSWDAPIYLNIDTAVFFFFGIGSLFVVKIFWIWRSGWLNEGRVLKWAITFDLIAFAVFGAMILTPLATFAS